MNNRRHPPARRGSLLIEIVVATGVICLVLGVLVPFEIDAQHSTEAMRAQARAVAAARETAAQIRRDVQESSGASVAGDRLTLRLRDRSVTYSRSGDGWVRRSTAPSEPPVWVREELRSMRFSREGRAVRAELVSASLAARRHTEPIRVEVFAMPRNGGG